MEWRGEHLVRRVAWIIALAALLAASPAPAAPRWTDGAGRPNAAAIEAVALLNAAADEGLDPRDYDAAEVARMAERLRASAPSPPAHEAVQAFEAALSRELPRYLRHLHQGRVDARSAGFRLPAPRDEPDFDAVVEQARTGPSLRQAAASLAPAVPAYGLLRHALARYRVLAADPTLTPWRPGPALRPGERGGAVRLLRARLRVLGDLPPAAPDTGDLYDPALEDAVRRFQARHGLVDDGVAGAATQSALAVPPARRVRQIELSMERLRWLPRLPDRFIGVNIPMFRVWAVNPRDEAPLGMKVVVGRALNTRTPVLLAPLRQVVFRPYWNVPRSIVRGEVLPAMERDPGAYLVKNDMEIVRGAGDDARPVEPTPANLALLREGALRLRQRPGARNSLGLVKFVFPNDSDVYLHGTPAQGLFAQARRDFSHGCIRVEDPVALAEWVLRDQPPWTRERIVEAMHGERTQTVTLAHPLPVVLYYVTALAAADGTVRFAEDVYGHDARLERVLHGL